MKQNEAYEIALCHSLGPPSSRDSFDGAKLTTMSDDQRLIDYVTQSLLPTWKEVGVARDRGCFWERLDEALSPIDLGYERLLTQARLIFSFSEGSLLGCPTWAQWSAADSFRFICSHYWDTTKGGWYFSLGNGGPMPWQTRQLYAHAFVLLACSSYYRATGDTDALLWADRTLDFLNRHFRISSGGFATALDGDLADLEEPLQQNPHMHLFEACIDLYASASASKYVTLGAELVDLLLDKFIDRTTGTLTEFFDGNWKQDRIRGHIVEPGHHFEWVWLIHRWLRLVPEEIARPSE